MYIYVIGSFFLEDTMKKNTDALKIFSILSVLAISITGCAKPWGLIHEGMDREEVHRKIGQPDFHGKTEECWRNQDVSDWSGEKGDYCIYFMDGKVQEYGWVSKSERRSNSAFIFVNQI